jgi:cyanoexosortase A
VIDTLRHKHWFSTCRPSRWELLAILVVIQNLILNFSTQSSHLDDLTIILLIWFGAWLVLPTSRPWRNPQPSTLSLWLGLTLLASSLWRSSLIYSPEPISFVLPFLTGVGLALLIVPIRRMKEFYPSLFLLSFFPILRAFLALTPQEDLAKLNTQIVRILLLFGSEPVQIDGYRISLPGGGISVLEGCNGLSTLAQLFLVSTILFLAFPMRHRWQNTIMLFVAPLIGLLINCLRIVCLAIIISSDWASKTWWFDQLHDGLISLTFPALAMLLFLQIYMVWLEHQVAMLEKQ